MRTGRPFLLAAVLFALTALVYTPAYRGGFLWDDDLYVSENPLLTASDGLFRIWFSMDQPSQYFPLVYTSFRIEHALWGLDTTGYHVVNVVLHALTAMCVWRVLVRLGFPIPWLVAAIFAVHPVQVESVAWITERKNVLMGLFLGLSALCWTAFAERPVSGRARRLYVGSLALYALALLSKASACTFPAAQAAILFLRGERPTRRRALAIAPFVAMGLVMGLFTIWWERVHQGTRPEVLPIGFTERFLIASRTPWFYLAKVLWPVDLAFSYPKWTIDPADPAEWVWPLLGIAAVWLLWRSARVVGQGPLWAAAFFFGTLLPTSGIILLATFRYTYVADHYQYIACLGPIALVCAAGHRLVTGRGPRARLAAAAAAGVVLTILSALTWRQAASYESLERLWSDTLAKNPESWLAHNNLGTLLMERGEFGAAESHFRKAVAIAPSYPESRNNLAVALARQGRTDEAVEASRRAVAETPRSAAAWNTLGLVLARQGRLGDAETAFREALHVDPRYFRAHLGLGTTLYRGGRAEDGIASIRDAVRLAPESAEVRFNLSVALAGVGRQDEALEQAEAAVRLEPGNEAYRRQRDGLRGGSR